MILQQLVTDNYRANGKYMLLAGVTDDDATILRLCGAEQIEDFDEMDYNGNNYEAWKIKE